MARRIVIETPARLHLGLVNPFVKSYRLYMAVGVAIDEPRTVVSVYTDKPLSIEGCRSEEVYTRLEGLIEKYDLKVGRVLIEKCIPKHVGLGSTTQLLLSVAHGLMLANGLKPDVVKLAKDIGLGRISGVGVYVYMYGGFVIDSGKLYENEFPQLLMRYDMPEDWRFIVVIPRGEGLDEAREAEIFTARTNIPSELVLQASHTLFTELVPSLIERRFEAFARALTKFQELVGMMFSEHQGGIFAHYSTSAIEAMKKLGIIGLGQSSWGPTVYGLVDGSERSLKVLESLRTILGDSAQIYVTKPRNRGAFFKLTT